MTLPASKSRTIAIDGARYRWAVAHAGPTGHALFVHFEGGAARLAVELVAELDGWYWLGDDIDERPYVGPVTPKWVRFVVEQAANQFGWSPSTDRGTTWVRFGERGLEQAAVDET